MDLTFHDGGTLLDRAIARLGNARAASPDDAGILNNLGVARYERAVRQGRSIDLFWATDHFREALELDATMEEAWFNLALTASRLRLTQVALDAWSSFLQSSEDREWKQEAIRRRSTLEQRRQPLGVASEAPWVDRAEARRERALFGLLASWGTAYLEGSEDHEQILDEADSLATVVATESGDRGAENAVAVIRSASRSGDPLTELARGHKALAEGWTAFEARQMNVAADLMRDAQESLERTESAAALWARLVLAVETLSGPDRLAGEHALEEVRVAAAATGQTSLIAEAELSLGGSVFRRGLFDRAERHFSNAVRLTESLGEASTQGRALELWVETLAVLGQRTLAADRASAALDVLSSLPGGAARHFTLLASGHLIAGRMGARHAALTFFDEAVANARLSESAHYRTEAHIWRARTLGELLAYDSAMQDLAIATRLASLNPPSLRARFDADIAFAAGRALRVVAPAEALDSLSVALERFEVVAGLPNVLDAYVDRAMTALEASDQARAEDDLEAAIDLLESQKAALADPARRATFFDEAERVFDAMIALKVRAGRPLEALAHSERARDVFRTDDDGVAATSSSTDVTVIQARLRRITDRLPEAVTVVEYSVGPSGLAIWVVRGERLDHHWIDVSEPRIDELVDQFVTAVRGGADRNALRALGEPLYELLIDPIKARIRGSDRLVIVPDKALHALPFAALVDPLRGDYLVERTAVSLAPSLHFLDRGATTTRRVRPGRALLVAPPSEFGDSDIGRLPALPFATEEIRALRGVYGAESVLEGSQATAAELMAQADRYEVLHFAGHAILDPRNPGRSYLLMASGESDGSWSRLSAGQLRQTRLERLQTVVLSACSTLASEATRTGGLSGIARAFVEAGAQGVVGALWDVDDESTMQLMLPLHEALSTSGDAAQALRTAQRRMIETGRYSPVAWAAFQYVGS